MKKTYKVYDKYTGDGGNTEEFTASSPDRAAEDLAESRDETDGEVSEDRWVMVAEVGSDEWRQFDVTGEVTVQYHATENEEEDE